MLTSASTIASNLPTAGGFLLTGVQIFLTCANFSTETKPETRAQYSKFAQQDNTDSEEMIGSKDGMTIIYAPAFVASSALYFLPEVTNGVSFIPAQTLAATFVIIHFMKRLLEVFFLHKYSGKVSKSLSSAIGFYYAIVAAIILFVANPTDSVSVLSTNIGTGERILCFAFILFDLKDHFTNEIMFLELLCIIMNSPFYNWNIRKSLPSFHSRESTKWERERRRCEEICCTKGWTFRLCSCTSLLL